MDYVKPSMEYCNKCGNNNTTFDYKNGIMVGASYTNVGSTQECDNGLIAMQVWNVATDGRGNGITDKYDLSYTTGELRTYQRVLWGNKQVYDEQISINKPNRYRNEGGMDDLFSSVFIPVPK